ncbi:MAG TPA: alpha/beta fold hydrolase [Acidimicrobiales bacterium]
MDQFTRDGLVFDVVDAGPPGADAIVLLHGFPETSASWRGVAPGLAAAGYRVLAPDQRGYSAGARPRGRRAYRTAELAADVVALADQAGVDRFHVVGHDWGGGVAWSLGIDHAARLKSLTVLSTPHPEAMVRSFIRSDQGLRSWYMLFFQLPAVPERVLLSGGGRRFRRGLTKGGLPADLADAYYEKLRQPGALTAALNWYRALPFQAGDMRNAPGVTVPTLYVWSTGDFALGRRAAELTADHVTGPYRFEVLEGVSHWIPEERPDDVVRLVLEQVRAYP